MGSFLRARDQEGTSVVQEKSGFIYYSLHIHCRVASWYFRTPYSQTRHQGSQLQIAPCSMRLHYCLSLIGRVRLLHGIPIDCLRASSLMVSMKRRVRICSAMAISKAANVHGQTGVRLDDLVVVLSNGLGSRFSAVHVVLGLAMACIRRGVSRF